MLLYDLFKRDCLDCLGCFNLWFGGKKIFWLSLSLHVLQNTGFEDDNDDDWDISSLEDVPVAHTSSFAPVRKSMDKSIDTSTSVWGTFTGIGQEPSM